MINQTFLCQKFENGFSVNWVSNKGWIFYNIVQELANKFVGYILLMFAIAALLSLQGCKNAKSPRRR